VLDRVSNTAYSGPPITTDRRGFPKERSSRTAVGAGTGAAAAAAVAAALLVPQALDDNHTRSARITGLPTTGASSLSTPGTPSPGASETTTAPTATTTATSTPTGTSVPTTDVSSPPPATPGPGPTLTGMSVDHSSLFTSDTQCTPKSATVVVDAHDADGIATITLHWVLDQPTMSTEGQGQMVPQGGDHYSAGLGPFPGDGTARYWVTATDTTGQESMTEQRFVNVTSQCIA
jgi:hypothetical protein